MHYYDLTKAWCFQLYSITSILFPFLCIKMAGETGLLVAGSLLGGGSQVSGGLPSSEQLMGWEIHFQGSSVASVEGPSTTPLGGSMQLLKHPSRMASSFP